METESQPIHISDLFGHLTAPQKPSRKTERGELLSHFAVKLGKPLGYVAFKTAGLSLQDLYFIKSDCSQAEHRGIPWGAAFHTALKPKEV